MVSILCCIQSKPQGQAAVAALVLRGSDLGAFSLWSDQLLLRAGAGQILGPLSRLAGHAAVPAILQEDHPALARCRAGEVAGNHRADAHAKWWYRSVEEPHDVDLAWRFALSRKGVVAGIPPSYFDLVDKAIEAAKSYRPATESELDELKKMAVNCPSLFEADEKKYAQAGPHHTHDDGSECYA